MKMVRPTYITDSNLTSTDVPENDYAVYASGTTYATGDRVIVTTGYHAIYESLEDSNTGNFPPDNMGGTSPKWLFISATNAWKMFDANTLTNTGGLYSQIGEIISSQTVQNGSIEVVIEPVRVNTVALLNVQAQEVTVEMVSGIETVYSKTKSLTLANVANWYEYFFEPISYITDVVFDDLPIFTDGVITITIENGTSDAKCGQLITGMFKEIGATLHGTAPSILSYSTKTTDTFGNVTWVRRGDSKTLEADIFVERSKIDETYRLLSEYSFVPVLWVGDNNFSSTILFGLLSDFTEVVTSHGEVSLTIEGLT